MGMFLHPQRLGGHAGRNRSFHPDPPPDLGSAPFRPDCGLSMVRLRFAPLLPVEAGLVFPPRCYLQSFTWRPPRFTGRSAPSAYLLDRCQCATRGSLRLFPFARVLPLQVLHVCRCARRYRALSLHRRMIGFPGALLADIRRPALRSPRSHGEALTS